MRLCLKWNEQKGANHFWRNFQLTPINIYLLPSGGPNRSWSHFQGLPWLVQANFCSPAARRWGLWSFWMPQQVLSSTTLWCRESRQKCSSSASINTVKYNKTIFLRRKLLGFATTKLASYIVYSIEIDRYINFKSALFRITLFLLLQKLRIWLCILSLDT